MTQPIDRETAIALATEVWCCDIQSLGTANLEVFANLAVAQSRKDAEPVAWRKENQDGFYRYYERDESQPVGCEPLYTHPPEADKLLQQALEVVLDEHLPGFTEDAPRQHDDVIYDKAIEDAADAIRQLIARTYLEKARG